MSKTVLLTALVSTLITTGTYYTAQNYLQAGQVDFVKGLDIERFMGQWYVIVNKPNFIESNCKCSRTLDTRKDVKTIELAETCQVFGKWITSTSKAVIEEPSTGHWTNWMSFKSADYWVIDADLENYEWSVIGQPSKQGYWIMSRKTTLDQSIVDKLVKKAKNDLGYDLSNLEVADQSCK